LAITGMRFARPAGRAVALPAQARRQWRWTRMPDQLARYPIDST
jgi:hypothetical protein